MMNKTTRNILIFFVLFAIGGPWQTEAAQRRSRAVEPALPRGLEPISEAWIGFGVPGRGLRVEGSYLYLAPGEGDLCVYDIHDLQRPRVAAYLGVGFVGNLVPFGPKKFLAGPRGPDALIDVADPTRPVRKPLRLDFSALPEGGKAVGDLRDFVPFPSGRLVGLCPYSPRAVFLLQRRTTDTDWHAVGELTLPDQLAAGGGWRQDHRLYLLVRSQDRRPRGLGVVDLSEWPRPRWLGLVLEPHSSQVIVRGLSVDHRRLAVVRQPIQPASNAAAGQAELTLLDVADIHHPKELSNQVIPGYPLINDLKLHRDHLYLALACQPGSQDEVSLISETGRPKMRSTSAMAELRIDRANKLRIVSLFHSPALSRYTRLAVTDRAVFLSDYNFGLWCLRRGQDGKWKVAGGAPAPAEGHFVSVRDGLAFVTTTFASLVHVIDVHDPQQPHRIGWFWNQQWILNAPASAPGALYLPMRYGINIVEVSDPRQPRLVGAWPWEHESRESAGNPRQGDSDFRLWSDGKHAIVLARRNVKSSQQRMVLAGYDLADPLHPRRIWFHIPNANVYPFTPTISVEGDRMYLNNVGGRTLEIFQRSPSGPPGHLGSFSTGNLALSRDFNVSYPGRFSVRAGMVYLLNGGEIKADQPILHVVDARQPSRAQLVRSLYWPKNSFFVDLAVRGKKLYLQQYWSPIAIYDLAEQEGLSPRLSGQAKATWAGWSLGQPNQEHWFIPGLSHLAIYRIPTGLP